MDRNPASHPRSRRPGLGLGLGLVVLVLAALGGPGLAVRAQDAPAPPTTGGGGTPVAGPDYYAPPTTISVGGRGTVRVEPDTASVTVGVDVVEDDLSRAQAAATQQATAIIDAVRAAGVAERDVQTANYSVNIIRDYDDQGNLGPITGYQVSNEVNVTVRDLDALGTILDDVVAAGANNIYGVSFSVEDTEAAASQARAQALADARSKAEELAAASGLTIVRASSIIEGYAPPPVPVDFGAADTEMMAQRAGGAPVPVQTGTTEVVVDVQVTYEAR